MKKRTWQLIGVGTLGAVSMASARVSGDGMFLSALCYGWVLMMYDTLQDRLEKAEAQLVKR